MTNSKQEWDTKEPSEDGSVVGSPCIEVRPDYTSYYKNRANGLRIHLVDKNGLLVGSRLMTPEDIKHIIREERQRVVEMLWSIHVPEDDEEMESYNRALDRAIFKLSDLRSKLGDI